MTYLEPLIGYLRDREKKSMRTYRIKKENLHLPQI